MPLGLGPQSLLAQGPKPAIAQMGLIYVPCKSLRMLNLTLFGAKTKRRLIDTMKLATLKNGRPDGQLVVVSRDVQRFVSAGRIAANLQQALDEWEQSEPQLQELSTQLNNGDIAGQAFDSAQALAPLPRAYQWIDGAGYLSHLERVRNLKGSKNEEIQDIRPLMYQGGSDSLSAPTDPILLPSDDLAADFEGELAVILGPVSQAATVEQGNQAVRLFTICNDVSLRRLVVDDLQNGFGFFHAKPSTSFAPVVATPDEFAGLWKDGRLSLTLKIEVNDQLFGQPNTGTDMHFSFGEMIAEAARTRPLGCGTIFGGGTVSNRHDETLPIKRDGIGFACIVEARTVERAKFGKPRTHFLAHGDRVRMTALDNQGASVFGSIDQPVARYEG